MPIFASFQFRRKSKDDEPESESENIVFNLLSQIFPEKTHIFVSALRKLQKNYIHTNELPFNVLGNANKINLSHQNGEIKTNGWRYYRFWNHPVTLK